MKKSVFAIFFFTLFALVLLVLATVYFSNTPDREDIAAPEPKPDIPSTDNGLSFSLTKRQISLEHPVVDIIIENESNDEAMYGSDLVIEKLVNEEWKQLFPIKDKKTPFTAIGYSVAPHATRTETVQLRSYLEDELTAGDYRIVKELEHNKVTRTLGITFEIE